MVEALAGVIGKEGMLFMACRADTVIEADDEDVPEGEAATVVKGKKTYTILPPPCQKPAVKGLAQQVQEGDRRHIPSVQPKSAKIRCQLLECLLEQEDCRGIPADRMPITTADSLVIDAALLNGIHHEGREGGNASGAVPKAGHGNQWLQGSKAGFLMSRGAT
jgi:hypothetical protein